MNRIIFFFMLLILHLPSPFVLSEEATDESVDPAMTVKGEGDTVQEGVETRNISVAMGVSKVLEFPFEIGPVYVTDTSLLNYQRVRAQGSTKKLMIIARSPGLTDMTVHDQKQKPRVIYYIRVTREHVGQIMTQLNHLLGDIEGIEIKPVGGTVVIDGDIVLPKDMVRIMRVTEALKDRDAKKKNVPIRNISNISILTMNLIAEQIEREIGSPDIQVRVLNNSLIIEGTAQSALEADRAVNMAKLYLPEVFVQKNKGDGGEVLPKDKGGQIGGLPTIIDMLRVAPSASSPPSKDIKITMNYVELTNEYDRTFNFSWKPLVSDNSSINVSSTLGQITTNLLGTISSLFPKLAQAKSHGHARILKQEQLIVKDRSDQPAAIESAVDFYITTTDPSGNVTPTPVTVQNTTRVRAARVPGSDSIELGIQITLNSLVGTQDGSPIIAKNSLQTQVTIKDGDSAALGGYAVDEALAGYNRAPQRRVADSGAENASPIFNFDRSKNYRRNKQQYVIFVTPEVINTASSGTEDITRKFRLNAGEN